MSQKPERSQLTTDDLVNGILTLLHQDDPYLIGADIAGEQLISSYDVLEKWISSLRH